MVSWLALRGKCSACGAPIGVRYPLVELATAALFALARLEVRPASGRAGLVRRARAAGALALIDWTPRYLPDDLTLPLLWAGLIVAALGWTVPLPQAVWGAVAGYVSLWLICQAFKPC